MAEENPAAAVDNSAEIERLKKEIDLSCPEPTKKQISKILTDKNPKNVNIQYCCDYIDNLFDCNINVFLISLGGVILILIIVYIIK